jgi:hypothetical protein
MHVYQWRGLNAAVVVAGALTLTHAAAASATPAGPWPKLVVTAMAYSAPRTHVALEAPTLLPKNYYGGPAQSSALVANTASVDAGPHTYTVSLSDCSPPLPLNSPQLSALNGTCSYQMAIFGSFGGASYSSGQAATHVFSTAKAQDLDPEIGCNDKSLVRMSRGVVATVYSDADEPTGCVASWQQRGWTFVFDGGLQGRQWVGLSWIQTADQIIDYTARYPLPGSRGVFDATFAGDGLPTTLIWLAGEEVYSTFTYHGALPAVQMAASMRAYP